MKMHVFLYGLFLFPKNPSIPQRSDKHLPIFLLALFSFLYFTDNSLIHLK